MILRNVGEVLYVFYCAFHVKLEVKKGGWFPSDCILRSLMRDSFAPNMDVSFRSRIRDRRSPYRCNFFFPCSSRRINVNVK